MWLSMLMEINHKKIQRTMKETIKLQAPIRLSKDGCLIGSKSSMMSAGAAHSYENIIDTEPPIKVRLVIKLVKENPQNKIIIQKPQRSKKAVLVKPKTVVPNFSPSTSLSNH